MAPVQVPLPADSLVRIWRCPPSSKRLTRSFRPSPSTSPKRTGPRMGFHAKKPSPKVWIAPDHVPLPFEILVRIWSAPALSDRLTRSAFPSPVTSPRKRLTVAKFHAKKPSPKVWIAPDQVPLLVENLVRTWSAPPLLYTV